MKTNNVIELTPRIKDSLYVYLSGVGFRRKRGALTLRQKLERKSKLTKKAKILPFRVARVPLDKEIPLVPMALD
jgi:hypothetical protein